MFHLYVNTRSMTKKTFQGYVFQNSSYVSKTTPKLFLKCSKKSGSE